MARTRSSDEAPWDAGVAVVMLLAAGVTVAAWLAWARQATTWQQPTPVSAHLHGRPQVLGQAGKGALNPVDIGFAQDMSLHHEQALTMARMALSRASLRVQGLAQLIVDQQLRELGVMQGWLMLLDAPPTAERDDMAWMRDAYARSPQRDPAYDRFIESCIRGEGMPGLATPGQLDALTGTPDAAAFDQAFLALMVRHHQGAVVMARFASEHAGLEVVRGLARSVAAEQRQEMVQMLAMLRQGDARRDKQR